MGLLRSIADFLSKSKERRVQRSLKREISKKRFAKNNLKGTQTLLISLILAGFFFLRMGEQQNDCSFILPVNRLPNGLWSFGEKTDYQDFHTGEDYMGSFGEPIYASSSGRVVWAGWWPETTKDSGVGHGNTVVIETYCNGVPYYHYYAHTSVMMVRVGDKVVQGQRVAEMGMTGAGEGVHLHFAISEKGPLDQHDWQDWLDPVKFLADHSVGDTSINVPKLIWIVPGYVFLFAALALVILHRLTSADKLFVPVLRLLRHSLFPGFLLAMWMIGVVVFTSNGWEETTVKVSANEVEKEVKQTFNLARATGKCEVSSSYPESILQWCEPITYYARENNLPPNLVAAIMLQESGGDSLAYSHSGAVGLLQVMPRDGIASSFVNDQGVPLFYDRPTIQELQDPEFNLEYGTQFFAGLYARTGSYREALFRYGPSDVGYSYADSVLSIWQQHGGT